MTSEERIQKLLDALARRPFRAKFHLHEAEQNLIAKKGLPTIRQHAADLIGKRLAPAYPERDGKQTPYKGHPVFIAQHATATCCRGCLERWQHIPKGRVLSDDEQCYIIAVIETWLRRELK